MTREILRDNTWTENKTIEIFSGAYICTKWNHIALLYYIHSVYENIDIIHASAVWKQLKVKEMF